MAKRDGFTLASLLLSLSICLMVIYSFGAIYCGLGQIEFNNHDDLYYAIVSISHEVNMANAVSCDQDVLTLFYPNQTYTFILHHNRLVKQPGFDIYLHQIDDLSFYHDEKYVYLEVTRGEQKARFTIGVYFRPNQNGICTPDRDDDPIFTDGFEYATDQYD